MSAAALYLHLTAYFAHNPRWRGELPNWLSVALWAHDYLPTKPPPGAVEVAQLELREVAV